MKFQTIYKHEDVKGIDFPNPSMTEQQFAYEADINNIVKGFVQPQGMTYTPQFGQTFDANMYCDSLNIIASAKSEFYKMPSSIRREFNNDPQKLVEFLDRSDETSIRRGVDLGIYEKSSLDKFKPTPTNPTEPVAVPVNEV